MKRTKNFRLLTLCGAVAIAVAQLRAQTITQGGFASLYQQLDNTSGNTNDWSRSMGVGYFWPNGMVPESFLHVNSRFSLLPMNGSIASVGETFRTTVAGGVSQFWRMERDVNQIGLLWNESAQRAFHVQSGEQRDDAGDRYSGLMLQNHVGDGLWVMNDGPPTGGRAFPNPLQLLDAKGFAGLGIIDIMRFPGAGNPRGPWSRFHLFHDVSPVQPWFAHRSQMRNGITLTGNSDHAYIGHWYDQGEDGNGNEVDDRSNLVIATSEDAIPEGHGHFWDNISFRFFSDLSGADGAASSVNGLETMRIQPHRPQAGARVEGLVGIGDFLSASAAPEERLDLLDRTLRIRSMGTPGLYQNNALARVLVVDPADGRVHWRDASTLGGGGADCKWTLLGGNDIATAYTGNPGCPQDANRVGIGTSLGSISAKLAVQGNSALADVVRVTTGGYAGASNGVSIVAAPYLGAPPAVQYRGVHSTVRNATGANAGVETFAYVDAGFTTAQNYGLKTLAQVNASGSASNNIGLVVDAVNNGATVGNRAVSGLVTGTCTDARGVSMRVDGGASLNYAFIGAAIGGTGNGTNETYGGRFIGYNSSRAFGVYAEADGGSVNNYGLYAKAPAVAGSWAGFFQGNVEITGTGTIPGGVWIPSDAQLKTDVQSLDGALDVIAQLEPSTYQYVSEAAPGMQLPQGTQAGLLAQQLEQVLPALVHPFTQPAEIDSTGNVIHPAFDYKGINYIGLVPYLIAGIQELQEQNQQFQAQLAQCCATDGRSVEPGGQVGHGAAIAADDLRTERLQIIPNPVALSTTLRYYVPRAGRVRLELSAEDGRALETLLEMRAVEGEQQYTWDTGRLSAGVYLVALVVDGQVVVKRALKVE
jgi:hypothetical protein